MDYISRYIEEAIRILQKIDQEQIEQMLTLLTEVQGHGARIFFLGVGGGAGHASHAVNDFRKIAGIESYTGWRDVI
jgi:D-sedoheptulose 7-phosphate isomerase